MALEDPNNKSIEAQARHWLVRQHSGDFTHAERRAFERWLASHADHREACARLEALWHKLDEFKSGSFPAREAARSYRSPARLSWFPPLQVAVGLSLGLVVIIGLIAGEKYWLDPAAEQYQTRKGEQKSITLADGSLLELNTDTTVRVEYTRRGRTIQLDSGEALFTVSHGDERPFDVLAGAGRIRDIGTRFNVYKRPDAAVIVAVLDGSVSVTTDRTSPTVLVQGDRLAYSARGSLGARDHIEPAAASAWREGRIIFSRTPLREVMTQLARYHEIDVRFDSPELAQMRLSGAFGARDLPVFLATLAATLPVEARVEGQMIHLAHARTYTLAP